MGDISCFHLLPLIVYFYWVRNHTLLHVNLHWTTLKTSGLSCATTSLDSSLVLNKLQYIPPCSDVYKTLVFQSEVVVREYQNISLKIVKHSTNILEQVVNSSSMVTQVINLTCDNNTTCETHLTSSVSTGHTSQKDIDYKL